ncbi:ABC transporter permease [Chamaesiphon sp.]|uniref:ABC transporter permease n=1 Tax=Chamaesiphon sp. TaxID=2814140 RepID=UPI003593542F
MYIPKSIEQKSRLSTIERYWELVSVLARRELKVRYRGSFLGIYWSLFNPLMMTGLYAIVFGGGFKKQYYNDSLWEYALAAFTGLTVIQFYNSSTSQALASIVSNNSLLNKVKLPVSIFPVSVIVANTFQLLIGMLPLLITVTIFLSPHSSTLVNVIAIPIPLLGLILISAGIGFLTSALYVFFRDLPFLYELVQFVILMSSPTFYPAEFVPAKIRQYLDLNPLYPVIESLRQVVLSGDLPDPTLMFRSLLSGIIILAIGWVCFNWLRPKFMDLL